MDVEGFAVLLLCSADDVDVDVAVDVDASVLIGKSCTHTP